MLNEWKQRNITASMKRKESPKIIESEAKNGDPIARYLMGERYYTGTGVERDLKKAISYFDSAGWHGYVPAQFRLATLFFEQPDYFKEETGGRLMTAAEKGAACLEKVFLRGGGTYSKTYRCFNEDVFKLRSMVGNEVTKFRDNETAFQEAFRWLWNAAKQGNTVVLLALGNWFREIDEEETKKWYRKAAEQGDPNVQLEIGDYFLKSDKEEAAKWYRKAAERAEQYVQPETGERFPDPDKEGARWFPNAADGDDPQALMAEWLIDLGRRFIGLDNEEAAKWLRKATDLKDDPGTQTIIGEWFLDFDENEAEQWLRKAAEQGEPFAMEYLGDLLEDRDKEEAEQWRRKAAAAKRSREK